MEREKFKIEAFRKDLQYPDPKGKVVVKLIIKEDKKESKIKRPEWVYNSEVSGFNPQGEIGELYHKEGGIIYVGIGDPSEKDYRGESLIKMNIQRAMGSVAKVVRTNYEKYEVKFAKSPYVTECLYGFIQAYYKFDSKYFTAGNISVFKPIALSYKKGTEEERIFNLATLQVGCRFLGDLPSNCLTPSDFAECSKELLEGHSDKVKVTVFSQEECKERKMGLFYSVAHGSDEEGKFVVIEFMNNPDTSRHQLGLVGKGVTFDSGGISLKPPRKMDEMKCDMMGGAIALGLIYLAAEQDLKINMTVVIPMVENMPSGKATNPGDVYVEANGKSVVIDNTDGEGRLIMASGFVHLNRKEGGYTKPEIIMSIATLTGAIKVGLGDVYGGYFSNNLKLSKAIMKSASETTELLHEMPFSSAYFSGMKGKVGDMSNISSKPGGGANSAAAFLYQFVDNDLPYAHFDVAGIAFNGYPSEIYGSLATARPLRAFYSVIEKVAEFKKE